MAKTAAEAQAEFIADLTSVTQILVRLRHGDSPDASAIEGSSRQAATLLGACEGDRLKAVIELFIRYGIK